MHTLRATTAGVGAARRAMPRHPLQAIDSNGPHGAGKRLTDPARMACGGALQAATAGFCTGLSTGHVDKRQKRYTDRRFAPTLENPL
jgi:hypothetical protein